jgi:S-formylglutathione hydrolase
MIVKAMTSVACTVALAVGATLLQAQGRGGPPVERTGTVEHITVHGQALEGNLEGDSPDRDVTVYLPAGYAVDETRRYPVVYLLHGYGGRDDTFTARLAALKESADRLGAAQGFRASIVVTPNAFTLHKGSMYSNSPTTGDWERFVAEDLVAYIDERYRTIANRRSRGLGGHSMGGYGAIRIGMKRPDVFSSLYIMSACCLTANRNPSPEAMAAAEAIRTREQAEQASRGPGNRPSVSLASAAAWSPNPDNPPLYLDLPMKGGKVRPDIVAKWVANAPLEMLEAHESSLKQYYAIAVDIGANDALLASNRQLHDAMTRLRIPHSYEEYDGDHTNRVRERIERNVLPFFSQYLAAPANPTSPSPQ